MQMQQLPPPPLALHLNQRLRLYGQQEVKQRTQVAI
jgi:hypothetical protein